MIDVGWISVQNLVNADISDDARWMSWLSLVVFVVELPLCLDQRVIWVDRAVRVYCVVLGFVLYFGNHFQSLSADVLLLSVGLASYLNFVWFHPLLLCGLNLGFTEFLLACIWLWGIEFRNVLSLLDSSLRALMIFRRRGRSWWNFLLFELFRRCNLLFLGSRWRKLIIVPHLKPKVLLYRPWTKMSLIEVCFRLQHEGLIWTTNINSVRVLIL